MTKKYIYLASPYSHHDVNIRAKRAKQVSLFAGKLIKKDPDNNIVFCPIAHSHAIQTEMDLAGIGIGTSFDYWQKQDIPMLERCTHLYVLMLQGWDASIGVLNEIELAKKLNLNINFISTDKPAEEDIDFAITLVDDYNGYVYYEWSKYYD